jgi:hypothetical protein
MVLFRTQQGAEMTSIPSDVRALPRFSLTPDAAAESTGFSRTRIFQAIRDEELTARKDGKATVIETEELLRWLRSLPTRGRREVGTGQGGQS